MPALAPPLMWRMRRALAAMLCASETNKAKCSEGLATAKAELQKISSKASDLYTELEATRVVAGSMGVFSASQQVSAAPLWLTLWLPP